MKAIDANCSQQACWSIAAVRTSSKRYQSRKTAQMHFPAKPGRFRREALTEASAARSTKAAAASTLLSRTARTEPVCPAPKMARPSSAAAMLSVSVRAENVCFCCIQEPLLCQMVNGRRDSAR